MSGALAFNQTSTFYPLVSLFPNNKSRNNFISIGNPNKLIPLTLTLKDGNLEIDYVGNGYVISVDSKLTNEQSKKLGQLIQPDSVFFYAYITQKVVKQPTQYFLVYAVFENSSIPCSPDSIVYLYLNGLKSPNAISIFNLPLSTCQSN